MTHHWGKQSKSCISLCCRKLLKVGCCNYLHHQPLVTFIPTPCPCLKLNFPSPIPWGQFIGELGGWGSSLIKY